MTKEEELQLVQRTQAGEQDAFEALVSAHEKLVYNLALRLLGNAQDAEDAAQEAFLKAYLSLGGFRGDSRFSVWLYRIVNNVCIDALRKRRDTVSLTSDGDGEAAEELEIPDARFDPVLLAERKELRERVGSALSALPEEQRRVLVLREVAGQSYEEIAETLSLDPGTVKSRIFRGRKKLCALLSEQGNFSGGNASNETEGGVQA